MAGKLNCCSARAPVDRARCARLDARVRVRTLGGSSSHGSGSSASCVVLVATVGGGLRDEFEIPGSDTQKATDLIEAEFASEQGAVLNIVFAAPAGQRARHARAQGGDRAAIARAEDVRSSSPSDGQGRASRASATRSAKTTFSNDGRIAYAGGAVRPDDRDKDRAAGRRRRGRRARGGRARGRARSSTTARPSSRRSSRDIAGAAPACSRRSSCCSSSSARSWRRSIPIALALTARRRRRSCCSSSSPGLTDINTITPILVSMIGLGVGIDYSLFIVTRFRQLLHDGLVAARRRGRGRRRPRAGRCSSPG